MADAKKFCGAVIQQTDARRACMGKHRAQLSRGCKVAIRQEMLKHLPRKGR
jgi:hypothetical protein